MKEKVGKVASKIKSFISEKIKKLDLYKSLESVKSTKSINIFHIAQKAFPAAALALLCLIPFFIYFKRDDLSNSSALYVYYFLCLTVLSYAAEAIFEKSKSLTKNLIIQKLSDNKYYNNLANTLKPFYVYSFIKIKSFYIYLLPYLKNIYEHEHFQKYFRKYFFISMLTLSISLPWIFSEGYLFFVDFVWGPTLILDYSSPISLIFSAMHILGTYLGQPFIQKLFVIGSIFLTAFAGKKIGGYSIAMLAVLNPFFYDRFMYGQIGVIYSYAFTLLITSIFASAYFNNKSINKKDVKWLGIYYGLSILFSPHFIFINGLYITLGILFIAKIKVKKLSVDAIKKMGSGIKKPSLRSFANIKSYNILTMYKYLKIFGMIILPVLIINCVWLYKLIFTKTSTTYSFVTGSIGQKDLQAFATLGDTFLGRSWNILNFQGFWGAATNSYLNISAKILYFWSPMILWIFAFMGLAIIYNQNKKASYYMLGFIFLIIILAQASTIAYVSDLLYNIPFYKGLREPQKWVGLLICIYIFLITIFIKSEKVNIEQKNKKIYPFLVAGLAIFWVPYLFFGAFGQIKAVDYPAYYDDIDEALNKNNCFGGKVAIMPWHMYIRYSWTGKVVANPAGYYFDCPVMTGTNMEWGNVYDNSVSEGGRLISQYVQSSGQSALPQGLNTIILFKDQDWKSYDYLRSYNVVQETDEYVMYRVK